MKQHTESTDLKEDFARAALSELDVPVGNYRVWIAATDSQCGYGDSGASACAYRIEKQDGTVEFTEVLAGRLVESSEVKGFVAGLLAAVERIPAGSDVVIFCRSTFIVQGINGQLARWFEEGRLHRKKPIAYASIWRRVLARIVELASVRAETDLDPEAQVIINELMARARHARPRSEH